MTTLHAPEDGRVWYLAGPMSGIPQFNYPMFFRVADALRNTGYNVRSPAEFDSPSALQIILASPDGAPGSADAAGSWGDFLSHDVKVIADEVNGIIFLPGWARSRGARLEAFVGLSCGHPFMAVDFFQDEMLLSDLSREQVKAEVCKNV